MCIFCLTHITVGIDSASALARIDAMLIHAGLVAAALTVV